MVILLGSLTAMGPLAIDMYLSSLPAIGRTLQAPPAATQATVAAFLAGMSIGQMFYGPASDRFGRRGPVLLGAAIFLLASVGCALATSIDQLLVGRFIQALGACAGAVVARAVVRDRFDHTETARMLSLMMLIMGLAPILAPLLGSALLTFGGWRLNFWFMAAFGLAVGLATLLRLRESRSEETARLATGENPFRAYLALLGERRLVGYALAGSLNGAALFTYISSAPGLLMGSYHVSVALFPWLFGLNAIAIIGANQVNRFLLRRFTTDHVLARASLMAVGCGLALTAAAYTGLGERWTVLPLLFTVMASLGFMQGNTMAGALSVDPRRAGSISALLGAASFGAGALAATAAGLLHETPARSMSLVMMLSLAASAACLHGLALPKRR
jgi:DHA1 family bicyclomycin/chloramphenicol resistance-like MFS transporter